MRKTDVAIAFLTPLYNWYTGDSQYVDKTNLPGSAALSEKD